MDELTRSAPTPRVPDRTVRVIQAAERQYGVVSRAQLTDCGLSGGAISRWIERGRLQRLLPGVYALGHRALAMEGRLAAALLYAGPGAALSHDTAAWWWGLVPARPLVTHVVAPSARVRVADVRIHQARVIERVRHRGLPVVPVELALLHLASVQPLRRLLKVLADAEYRGVLDPRAIQMALGRGRAGSRMLRRGLEHHLPELALARSELEERFLLLCRRSGIPIPKINVMVGNFLVDALWSPQRVVVELDGHAAHASPAAVERDRRRDLELRAGGYLVLRYTWRQVTREHDRVAVDLAAALHGVRLPLRAGLSRRGAGVVERGGLENRCTS